MERVLFNVEEGLFDYQSAEDYTIESLYDHKDTAGTAGKGHKKHL